jgi:uncharacterized protein
MAEQFVPLERLSRPAQWCVLLVASAGFAALLKFVGSPAVFILGSMIAAILVGIGGATIRVHPVAQNVAMAVIGCMIARSFTPAILGTMLKEWLLCLPVVTSTVAASSMLGWIIARSRLISGSTAVWGLSPGGASIMAMMAEEYGADGRLVAFMQYLRVVCVAAVAAIIARFWVESSGAIVPRAAWFPPVHWTALGATALIAGIGAIIGRVGAVPRSADRPHDRAPAGAAWPSAAEKRRGRGDGFRGGIGRGLIAERNGDAIKLDSDHSSFAPASASGKSRSTASSNSLPLRFLYRMIPLWSIT